uniref:Envelope membrane protein n=1 Tax=Olisthodiscus luteus TaxID=83000 RepID=A0A7U0KSX9_OLILU|nr:envelope membrane protein [Olisthodiscus luteus]QQW50538.1 envelope membrane protein [Olisthodiscus luteus]
MKNWKFKNISLTLFSLIPSSIVNSFKTFSEPFQNNFENKVIENSRISKNQKIVIIRYLSIVFVLPFLLTQLLDIIIFGPLVDFLWSEQHLEVFINEDQEKEAFEELRLYKTRYYLNSLNQNTNIKLGESKSIFNQEDFEEKIREKAFEITEKYKNESKGSTKNILSDIFYFTVTVSLIIRSRQQMELVRFSLLRFIGNLSDAGKAFFLILITNLLVGFHSPHGWEVFLELVLKHFGLPENRDFIFTFIATIPVLLDTLIKYWVFSYLNSIAPSTVVTYKNMNE